MDITNFIVSCRNDALLVGDYGSYRRQLSRRLLTLRRRLGCVSQKGRKYSPKSPITTKDIASNSEFISLLLLTSERAWAHAMYMKSMHAADTSEQAITGSTRTHIISRLEKARKNAGHLVGLLRDGGSTIGAPKVLVEAGAYCAMLRGSVDFESHKWEKCLVSYAEVHVAYASLAKSSNSSQADVFRDLLSNTVDISIRYAAYQLRLPRTMPIPRIVAHYLNKDSESVKEVLQIDPSALETGLTATKSQKGIESRDLPKTIAWRSRTVNIEDASIAQALASVSAAEQKLASILSSNKDMSPKDKATAYDNVLDPSQDAVHATKTAIDELTANGVAAGDQRIQSLQVTNTAVNYSLVGWRIGRNRVLCGQNDGSDLDPEIHQNPKKPRKDIKGAKEETNGRKLARLRERVVLYDSTLQSLDSVQELPGVAADKLLQDELKTKKAYFKALKCLALARSHTLLASTKNALALFARAQSLISGHMSVDELSNQQKPLGLEITKEHVQSLQTLLQSLVSQHRALVEIQNLHNDAVAAEKFKNFTFSPLIERLDEYPLSGADLTNLVIYPPRLRPVPVKPIFLDVAWNYIEYPGREQQEPIAVVSDASRPKTTVDKKETKKGWFGFGR